MEFNIINDVLMEEGCALVGWNEREGPFVEPLEHSTRLPLTLELIVPVVGGGRRGD